MGINIDGEYLNHLRFADDIILISHNMTDMKTMIEELNRESKKCGLKINITKTKILINKKVKHTKITLDDEDIEIQNSYVYLGQNFSLQEVNQSSEIKRRTQSAWAQFGKLNNIMQGNLLMCLKTRVFNQCTIPALTYGSETWTTTRKMLKSIAVTQRSMERIMIGITKRDKWTNRKVRQTTKTVDAVQFFMKLKWNWAGHIARRQDGRWTKRLTE